MGSSASLNGPFSLLPETRKPWTEFAFGIGTQALLVLLLVSVPLFRPQILDAVRHDYHAIELVPTPAPVNHQPQPVRVLKPPVVVAHLDPPAALHLPTPAPRLAQQPPRRPPLCRPRLAQLFPSNWCGRMFFPPAARQPRPSPAPLTRCRRAASGIQTGYREKATPPKR